MGLGLSVEHFGTMAVKQGYQEMAFESISTRFRLNASDKGGGWSNLTIQIQI